MTEVSDMGKRERGTVLIKNEISQESSFHLQWLLSLCFKYDLFSWGETHKTPSNDSAANSL